VSAGREGWTLSQFLGVRENNDVAEKRPRSPREAALAAERQAEAVEDRLKMHPEGDDSPYSGQSERPEDRLKSRPEEPPSEPVEEVVQAQPEEEDGERAEADDPVAEEEIEAPRSAPSFDTSPPEFDIPPASTFEEAAPQAATFSELRRLLADPETAARTAPPSLGALVDIGNGRLVPQALVEAARQGWIPWRLLGAGHARGHPGA
jgi:hypothetical protein